MEDQQKPVEQNSQPDQRQHDFESLVTTLKDAVTKFQEDTSPQNFAEIVTALSDFGISGADIWQQVASYTKRHPIRVAMIAGLAFFAMKGLRTPTKDRNFEASTVH